jgi:hypothetical protein
MSAVSDERSKMKKYKQQSFRPWPENQKRLELAGRIGLNVSEVINEILNEQFDETLKRKGREIQKALETVPA